MNIIPFVLGIDGMQHTGKGELIKMLVPYFQGLGYNVLVMKGAGSRSGTGSSNTLYNPVSDFRKELTPQLYENSLIESVNLREKATVQLQQELSTLLNQDSELPNIILLDRTILTSNFLGRLKNPKETIQETARYYQEQYNTTLYLPHALITFYARKKSVLEGRVDTTSNNTALKFETIKFNGLFNESIQNLRENMHLKGRTLFIDTDQPVEDIHNLVIQALNNPTSPLYIPLKNKTK